MYRKLAYTFLFSLLQILSTSGSFAQNATAGLKLQEPGQGVIGDSSVIQGVNTAGTVRVCNLANMEALLNIIANGAEIIGISVGCFFIIKLIVKPAERRLHLLKNAGLASAFITAGLAFPPAVNWFVATARDLNLFS